MPVGIQRLNARRSQPNPHIVFIKPLKGPDEEVARQFLERIAAQCVPIMRENHLSVVTLEEYEPNREFVGRNFNAGEVVQLVLKAPRAARGESGQGTTPTPTPTPTRWLPFSYVQMVMMHELAHCRQMNHSRAFWSVRDAFAAHMRRLWAAGYTGEGLWGRGAKLGAAAGVVPAYEQNVASVAGGGGGGGDGDDDGVLLDHLCGGTYRTRGGRRRQRPGKRKQAPALTYREREDRRVRRKFGEHGVALGGDLTARAALEGAAAAKAARTVGTARTAATKTDQKRLATKPRVAGSKRGRDLRAAAALARFEQTGGGSAVEKKEEEDDDDKDFIAAIKREDDVREDDVIDLISSSEGEGDDGDEEEDDEDDDDAGPGFSLDLDGSRMVDREGRDLVRVCAGESAGDDADARRELRELLQQPPPVRIKAEDAAEDAAEARPGVVRPPGVGVRPGAVRRPGGQPDVKPGVCPVCRRASWPQQATCAGCGHVLRA